MRLLVDSNVILSGLIGSKSGPGRIMTLWLERQCDWVTCEQQIEEMTRVLAEPYFANRVEDSFGSAYSFMRMFHLKAIHVVVVPPFEAICRDPNDDYLMAMLLQHPVDFLITGDKDLLSLKSTQPKILTPRELIDRL